MQTSKTLDLKFKDDVLAEPGGANLVRCYACGTCMSTCLVSRVSPEFNPRRTLHAVMLGAREAVYKNPTIWLCSACDLCYPQCPQNIHISELMHAIKATALRAGYEPPGPVAVVNESACSGCSVCVRACPYKALSLVKKNVDGRERQVSQVDKTLCMDCGICAGACPLGAITVEEYDSEKIVARMQADGWLKASTNGDPKLLVFNCNWCIRAEADLDAMATLPPNVRVVTIPCSGRIDPLFILLALREGADGVLVAGCEPGQCHYIEGTYIGQGKMHLLEQMFHQVGVDSGRVRFVQIGTAQRGRLPALVESMVTDLRTRSMQSAAKG